jgi:hypothetical protein
MGSRNRAEQKFATSVSTATSIICQYFSIFFWHCIASIRPSTSYCSPSFSARRHVFEIFVMVAGKTRV